MKVIDTIDGTTREYDSSEDMYDGIKAMFNGEFDDVVDEMQAASRRGEYTGGYEDYLAINIEW